MNYNKTVYQKVTMWIKHPDVWAESDIDEIIRDALCEHGIEMIESLPYEEDGLYTDDDLKAVDEEENQ